MACGSVVCYTGDEAIMQDKRNNSAGLPIGINFSTEEVSPTELGDDVVKILNFLRSKDKDEQLKRLDDWLKHDGLLFENGKVSYTEIIELARDPKELERRMPGDTFVCIGLLSESQNWYFRIFINEEMRDEELRAEYDITMSEILAAEFESTLKSQLRCRLLKMDSEAYYKDISHGEI
jgi:hypothetical protein